MVFWTLLIGCVIAAWAMLRTLGGEREWRLRELEHRLTVERALERRSQEGVAEIAGRIHSDHDDSSRRRAA